MNGKSPGVSWGSFCLFTRSHSYTVLVRADIFAAPLLPQFTVKVFGALVPAALVRVTFCGPVGAFDAIVNV